nr:hypothetical protein [Bacteriovorax sp.]
IPMELGPSIEQYALAERLGANAFFKLVRKTLSVTNETSAQRLNRSFQAVCLEAQSRIGYVNQGLERLKETNNRCMNYADFDAYSTPARDQGLHDLFLKLQSSYTELLAEDNGRSANPQLLQFASLIVNKKNPTNPELLLACPINYREGVSLDLSNLWIRISKGLLSSHPNDIIELRWGEKSSPATRCKRWY